MPKLDAISVVTFVSPPRTATVGRIKKRLDECVITGTHAYDAAHDQLTGLLNTNSFDAAILEDTERAKSSTATLEKVESWETVCLIAFDIDYFKQVNDQFGHDYGNLVLRCLAQRIESTRASLLQSLPGVLSDTIYTGPGGEEFAVLVAGTLSKDDEIVVAEKIREAISVRPLPDDEEWDNLKKEVLAESIVFPSASERNIKSVLELARYVTDLHSIK